MAHNIDTTTGHAYASTARKIQRKKDKAQRKLMNHDWGYARMQVKQWGITKQK